MTSEYVPVGYVLVPAALIVTICVTVGAWILMRSLKTYSAKWLFGFVVALIAWLPASQALRAYAPGFLYGTGAHKHLPPYTLIWMEAIGYGLFAAGAAVCFLLIALQAVRPNNSFKPNPLRGSA